MHLAKTVLGLLHIHAGLVAGDRYADNQNAKVIDAPQVAANFPDVDGVELQSPAFTNPESIPSGWKNATVGPTSQDTLVNFLKGLSGRNGWITYNESPELVSEEGRSLPYITLSNQKKGDRKLRIWFQGGLHGDEPAGDQGILALLGKFANDPQWTASVLEKADLLILPRYNPDGVAYFQRALASNYDPNRDHAIFQRQQTRDIKRLLSEYDPHIFLDAHEYTGVLPVNQTYIRAQDLLVSANKNQNIHKDVLALGEDFVQTVFTTAEKYGLRYGPYFTTSTSNGQISLQEPGSISQANHNSAGLLQSLTFLTETRGIRLADQHFQRRTAAGFLAAEAIINKAVEEFDLVYNTIENAREEFIASNADIIVVDQSRITNASFEFINASSGELVQVPVLFRNNTPSQVVLTRPRPKAYVFSRAWGDVAERLRILGVKVDVLENDFEGTVEALTVETAELATTKFEGIAATTVTTTASQRNVRIPAGGFYVNTQQKNAAYAFVLLEPENTASQVHYNAIPLEQGDEYPIFRVL
ncbi:Zn-dependent exopeptidase [Corynespora cassiicola Philippines]|uniref:Carboxypeptidase M14B n=1 Tax=Corynespora cassiicola Philippines TaxID=1448308 RepID=A0A2T2P7P0_CORCC|nr:Zn-dependent exopeptidase [Corynespora cassiicola Philippines]